MTIKIDIADTIVSRTQGLMFVKSIPDDYGMLFAMEKPQVLNFWGANTYIPLDIAFINEEKQITSIKNIVPMSYKTTSSDNDCKYALEVPVNFFKNNNIEVGSYIDFNESELTFIEKENLGIE